MSKPFLDFYGERKIIPVRQDISQLEKHFRKREALYAHLGLPPGVFRGRRIIEFGPGSGDDAVHTASLGPAVYTLVDGNPSSVQAVRDKIAQRRISAAAVACHESEISAYRDETRYDLVIAEGVVPGQSDPAAFLRHIAGFADVGGMIFCTAHSATSLLAETCRRLFKPVFAHRHPAFEDQLSALTAFVGSDLNSLKGMTRLHEDWVLDTVLHPWRREVIFSVVDVIDALDGTFEVHGTSPRFGQDWRWYKAVAEDPRSINDHLRGEYEKWAAYMIDYRVEPTHVLDFHSSVLERACDELYRAHLSVWEDDDLAGIPPLLDQLDNIGAMVGGAMPGTQASITDFISAMESLLRGDEAPDFGAFLGWFGRGLQYVSMVRRGS